jgi:hypothetical protein
MLKRYGKYLADWRDSKGKRLRKAFPTKAAALRHQVRMQKQATAKKARASGPRKKSARHTSRRSKKVTSVTLRVNSGGRAGTSRSTVSAK